MSDVKLLLMLIPALPLAASLLVGLLGRPLLRGRSHWPIVAAIGASLVCSLMLLRDVAYAADHAEAGKVGVERVVRLWTWGVVENALSLPADQATGAPARSVDFAIDVTLRADPLTAIMLVTVTFVALLVAIYSIGYMHDDAGYARYFACIGLFVFSMTMLVSVSNFLLLYVFWEAVGACSYLLIGFWFDKPSAAAAGKKAFLVNRIGDFGFAVAIFLIWSMFGTLNFHDAAAVQPLVAEEAAAVSPLADPPAGVFGQTRLAASEKAGRSAYMPRPNAEPYLLAICLLLMLGACGKSAQLPLHVWLPDAMEGPTPVSALIHAATMVTAGVYLVVRCTPLFAASGAAGIYVSTIGALTALVAGIIALTQTDLKRVLAYSTVSQLGFMFLALGTGSLVGIVAGMFHLFTHAFFKALLFLGAGSVMHAMGGVIDMRRFSGLRRLMPITYVTFLIGCLALAGFPLLSGFWSKDAILAAVHGVAHPPTHEHTPREDWFNVLYYVAMLTAFMTAFYTFRALFMTFFGKEEIPPEAGHHAQESPPVMTIPLVVLSVFAIGIGALVEFAGGMGDFLGQTPSLAARKLVSAAGLHEFHWDVALTSSLVALAGMGVAAYLYLGHRREAEWLAESRLTRPFYDLSYHKLFFDEVYVAFIVSPLRILATAMYLLDRWLIDGLVNLVGWIPRIGGALLRPTQRGLIPRYALTMALGVVIVLVVLIARKT